MNNNEFNVKEIINSLILENTDISFEKINELRSRSQEIKDELRVFVEEFLNNPLSFKNNRNFYFFPILFLSEMKDKESFPLFIKVFTLNEWNAYNLFDNLIREDLATILYSTYDGNYKLLEKYIMTNGLDTTCKEQGLMAYFKLREAEKVSKTLFLKFIRGILSSIEKKEEPTDGEIDIYTFIGECIAQYHIFDLYTEMRKICNSAIFEESVNGEYEQYIDDLFSYETFNKNVNVRKEINFIERAYMYRMYIFPDSYVNEPKESPSDEYNKRENLKAEMMTAYINSTKIKKPDGINKNDLCFCGSGKKYKHCCMNVNDEKIVLTRFEDYYDLLIDYPSVDNSLERKGLKHLFCDESIECDKLFFKALHVRQIPRNVVRNYNQEGIDKSLYLLEGLEKIYSLMVKTGINEKEEFENNYMIHYRLDDCTNTAIKIIHDSKHPQPQFNGRLEDIIFKINRFFN